MEMIQKLTWLVVSFFCGIAQAEQIPFYEKSYTSDVKFDDGINYETLVTNIQVSKAQTLEQVLELVPKDFYNNYVLVYRSRSLQDANPLYPRAIVFGKSSKFIMAFNGHKKQKGYNNLEMIQFREKEFRWEFREITFVDGKPPVFSEANPKKCLECHQSPKRLNIDPRPNWEPYNFWPGAYASVDSEIKPTLKKDYEAYMANETTYLDDVLKRFLPQDMVLMEEQAHEEENLTKFTEKIKPTHDRYKHLGDFSVRGPLNLTKSTVILNMRRVARILRDEMGELFNVYKYSLLSLGDAASMSSSEMLKYACGELYMPEAVRQKHIDYALKKRFYKEITYRRPKGNYGWNHGFAAGIDIMLMPLGILTDDLSMEFRTDGRFSFGDRFTSPHDSPTHFRDAVMLVYADDPAVKMDCKQLKAESEKSLQEFESNGGLDKALLRSKEELEQEPKRPLVERCISCHVNYEDGGQAPTIPFDDFSRLKPLLGEKKYPRGTLFEEILFRTSDHAPLRDQMPPAGNVDRSQRDDFIESIQKLLEQ